MDETCRQNAAKLLMELKITGMEMSSEMNILQNKDFYQYLTACLVTSEELRMGTSRSFIQKIKTDFRRLVKGNKPLNVKERYLRFERFVFLQNFKDKDGINQHTEARLFDVTGRIRKSLKDACDEETPNAALEEDYKDMDGFLSSMKKEFKELLGDTDDYYIVVFSYYLPCTQPDHLCASLIGRFAQLTNQHIILSYEMPYMTTDETMALDSMKSEYITIINLYPETVLDHHNQQGNKSDYNTDVYIKTQQRRPVVNWPNSNYFNWPADWIDDDNYNVFQDLRLSTWNRPLTSFYHQQRRQPPHDSLHRISSDIPRKDSRNHYDLWIRELPPLSDHYSTWYRHDAEHPPYQRQFC